MLRLGRGVRLQYETVTRGHVLLFPEGIVDLNASAHAILSKLPSTRTDLERRLCSEFSSSLLDGLDEFLETAKIQKWVVNDKTSTPLPVAHEKM